MRAMTMGRPFRSARGALALAGLALAGVASAGCGTGHERQALADTPPAARLVGAWDVRFHLQSPLIGRDTAGVPDVRGTIALVQDRWVRQVPQLAGLTHTGSYDVDFRPFGFEPRDVGQVPRAVARVASEDSVQLVLDPGDGQWPVVLRGTWTGDSIAGTWTLEPPERAVGGGGGRFVMTPRR
jgi:hypothetical protein